MALIKCPECGKDISNRTEKCVHCGYPVKQFILQKKKKKIRIEISCIIFFFIVIIISGCCYVLYLNDWNFDGISNAISKGKYSCIMGHEWQNATCTTAKKCLVCAYMIGNPLGHTWREATCTEPKTCTTCWITEGKALGHSTRMGTCKRCEKYICELEDEFEKITLDIFSKIFVGLTHISDNIIEASNSWDAKDYYVMEAVEASRDTYNELNNIYVYTKKYDEFYEISDYLERAIESIKNYPYNMTIDLFNCDKIMKELIDGSNLVRDYLGNIIYYKFK